MFLWQKFLPQEFPGIYLVIYIINNINQEIFYFNIFINNFYHNNNINLL